MKKRIIIGIILGIIFATGIPFFLPTKYCQASNNYISNIVFYKDSNNNVKIKFKVNTSFDINIGPEGNCQDDYCKCDIAGQTYFADTYYKTNNNLYIHTIVPTDNTGKVNCNTTYHFQAGQTYDTYWQAGGWATINSTTKKPCMGQCAYNPTYQNELGYEPTNTDYETNIFKGANWPQPPDTEKYYFKEIPNLDITFPADNADITEPFHFTGTLTEPSPYEYTKIRTKVWEIDPDNNGNLTDIGFTEQNLEATSTQAIDLYLNGIAGSTKKSILLETYLIKQDGTIYKDTNWNRYVTIEPTETINPPEEYPNWNKYLDIMIPSPDDKGYYDIKTPTSTITIIYQLPKTDQITADEDGTEKLATTTISDLDPYKTGNFNIDNIDASTSTIKYLTIHIYDKNDSNIVNAVFPIKGLKTGETENIGIWQKISNYIINKIKGIIIPSPAMLAKIKTDIPNLLKNKEPISYYYDITDTIANTQDVVATNTPAFKINLDGQTIEFNPLDINATGLTQTQGWKDLQAIAKAGLWFVFVIYVIGRIKDRTSNKAD